MSLLGVLCCEFNQGVVCWCTHYSCKFLLSVLWFSTIIKTLSSASTCAIVHYRVAWFVSGFQIRPFPCLYFLSLSVNWFSSPTLSNLATISSLIPLQIQNHPTIMLLGLSITWYLVILVLSYYLVLNYFSP